ncbi:MAG: hypothetical protein PHE09_17365 [Oscillospiraceae bacterium]|nr:hypothetical protein [Oscillospiraceae bacterium]
MYNLSVTAKQIFKSNILLLICCVFYLVWWLLAFKPTGAIKGMKTGWLLVPASVTGLVSIILAVRGIQSASVRLTLFPNGLLVWGGIAIYFILLAVTHLLFQRPVTIELFLIVGWTTLALSEINVLYGIGRFSHALTVIFAVIVGIAALISLICYVLYYNLGNRASYFDGMIPLLIVALVVAGISAAMVVYRN